MKTCLKCGNQFPALMVINGEKKNLQNRKYCLDCSPYGGHNCRRLHDLKRLGYVFEKDGKKFKVCNLCKKSLEVNSDNFYILKNHSFHSYCKKCNNALTIKRQQNLKQEAVNYKGGKCQHCGYDKYIGALDFHHTNPSEKDFSFSSYKNYILESIKKELDKCVLLCSNCHREEHYRLRKIGTPTST